MDSCSVELEGVRAGVVANTAPTAEALRRALAGLAVGDPDAPRNFSVLFSRDRRKAHLLYWGGCVAARSFDPDRILRSLCDHLGAHLPPPPGLVWIASLAYVRDGRAVLVPQPLKDDLRIVDRQLRSAGYVALDSPRSLLDPTTGELVAINLVQPDPEALRAAAEGVVRRRVEPAVPYGRYPVDRWVFIDYTGRWGPLSRADATRAAALQILGGIEHPDEALLAALAELFGATGASAMFPGYSDAPFDAVVGRGPR
ncbi:MAG: hypothetical protein ACRD0S_01400 [Acidimicrobiales bacterium]